VVLADHVEDLPDPLVVSGRRVLDVLIRTQRPREDPEQGNLTDVGVGDRLEDERRQRLRRRRLPVDLAVRTGFGPAHHLGSFQGRRDERDDLVGDEVDTDEMRRGRHQYGRDGTGRHGARQSRGDLLLVQVALFEVLLEQ
jgi:hypothetical protein